jgi:hypothetical protein
MFGSSNDKRLTSKNVPENISSSSMHIDQDQEEQSSVQKEKVKSTCHTPVPKEANRSFHMCAQDVQITRTTNNKVNSSQCYDCNIIIVYLL